MLWTHLWTFLTEVIGNWINLLGGIVGILIGFYERRKNRPFAGGPFYAVLVVALFAASFLAWREQRNEIERLHLDRITLTPTQLVQTYRGRTSTQGATLATVYIGKWIQVSGEIYDIQRIQNSYYMSIRDDNPDNDDWVFPKVSATFSLKWSAFLDVLKRKERITVLGKIREVTESGVGLMDCEILALPHETAQKPLPTMPPWWEPEPDPSPKALPSPTAGKQ